MRSYRNTPGNMKYGPRIVLNGYGISVQWWWFWPLYVVTLQWRPLRLRVPNWRGIR
jgi:hypothetical protein